MFARKRKDQPVGWSFLLKGEGLKERFASEAKVLGLAPILVDDVAHVHAGAKGKADGRARVVVARHAVRAALADACAAFISSSLLGYFLFVTPVSPLLRLGFSAVNSSLCAPCARRSSP